MSTDFNKSFLHIQISTPHFLLIGAFRLGYHITELTKNLSQAYKLVKLKLQKPKQRLIMYLLDTSTCTEWSMTRSTGHSGLIRLGSPPSLLTASRIAAKSTTAGTPLTNKKVCVINSWFSLYGITARSCQWTLFHLGSCGLTCTTIGHFQIIITLSLFLQASLCTYPSWLIWQQDFIHIQIKLNFHMNGCASGLDLIERLRSTQKLSIN